MNYSNLSSKEFKIQMANLICYRMNFIINDDNKIIDWLEENITIPFKNGMKFPKTIQVYPAHEKCPDPERLVDKLSSLGVSCWFYSVGHKSGVMYCYYGNGNSDMKNETDVVFGYFLYIDLGDKYGIQTVD